MNCKQRSKSGTGERAILLVGSAADAPALALALIGAVNLPWAASVAVAITRSARLRDRRWSSTPLVGFDFGDDSLPCFRGIYPKGVEDPSSYATRFTN
jgi:hypothetical protein